MIIKTVKNKDGLSSCVCDECGNAFERSIKSIRQSRKRRKSDSDYCIKCSYIIASKTRPQNSKEYWTQKDVINKHSISIKSSKKYYEGLSKRNTSGTKNSMFGKKHTTEAKEKMSASQTGKIRNVNINKH